MEKACLNLREKERLKCVTTATNSHMFKKRSMVCLGVGQYNIYACDPTRFCIQSIYESDFMKINSVSSSRISGLGEARTILLFLAFFIEVLIPT